MLTFDKHGSCFKSQMCHLLFIIISKKDLLTVLRGTENTYVLAVISVIH